MAWNGGINHRYSSVMVILENMHLNAVIAKIWTRSLLRSTGLPLGRQRVAELTIAAIARIFTTFVSGYRLGISIVLHMWFGGGPRTCRPRIESTVQSTMSLSVVVRGHMQILEFSFEM
jgi:hypothetical protein